MRNILIFAALVLLLTSCASPDFIAGRNESYSLNLKPYSDLGFLMSPYEYTKDFTMIGIIQYELVPDMRKVTINNIPRWIHEPVKTYQILDSVYQVCTRMGADALIDMDIQVIKDSHVFDTEAVTVYGLKVTGYAIDRKEEGDGIERMLRNL